MPSMNERDLYNPIKKYFENNIANNLGVKIKLIKTHDPIPRDIGFAHPEIRKVLKFYSYEPDLTGVIRPRAKQDKRWGKIIIIKIKTGPLNFSDFYNLRVFSEVVESDFSFLISPSALPKRIEEKIKGKEKIYYKNYYLKTNGKVIIKEIIVGKIIYETEPNKIKISNIEIDDDFHKLF